MVASRGDCGAILMLWCVMRCDVVHSYQFCFSTSMLATVFLQLVACVVVGRLCRRIRRGVVVGLDACIAAGCLYSSWVLV